MFDLCNILAKTVKHSINIECAARILETVPTPRKYVNATTDAIVWCKVGLLFGKIVARATDFEDMADYASVPTVPGAFYGSLVVALPRDYARFCVGMRQDIMLKGKVYLAPNTVTDAVMLRWDKGSVGSGVRWVLSPVEVTALDMTGYPPGLCFLYRQICATSVGTSLKQFYNLQGINPCGFPVQYPLSAVINHAPYSVTYDTVTMQVLQIDTVQQTLQTTDVTAQKHTDAHTIATSTELARVNRSDFKAAPEFSTHLRKLLNEKLSIQQTFDTTAHTWATSINSAMFVQGIVSGIRQNWVRKATKGVTVYTGRNLLEKTLCDAIDAGLYYAYTNTDITKRAALKTSVHAICMDKAQAMDVLTTWCDSAGTRHTDLCKNATQPIDIICGGLVQNSDLFVLLFLQRLLRLSCSLVLMQRQLKTKGLQFWNVVAHNPYAYCVLFPETYLKITDFDRLACLMHVYNNPSVQQTRAAVWMHQNICSTDENNNGSTVTNQNALLKRMYADTYTGLLGTALLQYQRVIDDDTVSDVTTFLAGYSPDLFVVRDVTVTQTDNKVTATHTMPINDVYTAYMSSIFGILLTDISKDAVTDATYLRKEQSIYEICEKRAVDETADVYIDPAVIEEYARKFEKRKTNEWGVTVKLEHNQREALQLVNKRLFAVTGGAGTGKTTIIELLTQIIQTERNIQDEEVLFIAPTGKAAVRLRNVVKRPTMTIHSACMINCENAYADAKTNKTRRSVLNKYKLVVVDEASMIDLDTMYTLMNALPDDCTTIFVGDIAQLAPIGVGKPFASMLQYIPVHALTVVKRVKDGDIIALNSHAFLDGTPLQPGSNYVISNIDVDSAVDSIESICTQYLLNPNGITPDDIQIITPVKRSTYAWGCEQLNNRLRPIFNPNVNNTTAVHVVTQRTGNEQGRAYYVGDRVVHTKNDKNALRYDVKTDGVTFLPAQESQSTGIMNGDIGKIRYIVDGCMVRFGNDSTELTIAALNKRAGKVYLFVEYQDVDVETMQPQSFLICYPLDKAYYNAEIPEVIAPNAYALIGQTTASTLPDVTQMLKTKYTVKATGLESLQLAYAMTVHKLEGSEVKLAICVLFGTKNRTFISRNLVNTMLTRATEKVYLLGDTAPNGILTQAYKIDVLQMRQVVYDFFPTDM